MLVVLAIKFSHFRLEDLDEVGDGCLALLEGGASALLEVGNDYVEWVWLQGRNGRGSFATVRVGVKRGWVEVL